MEDLNVTLKYSTGEKFSVLVPATSTVLDAKNTFESTCNVPASQQRLIYRGRILKDPELLTSYGISSGHIIHLVKIKTEPTEAAAGVSETPASATTSSATAGATSQPTSTDSASRLNLGDIGQFLSGLSGGRGGNAAGLQNLLGDNVEFNPQLFQNLISNPAFMSIMQELGQNPEFLRSMIQSNNLFSSVAQQNPLFQAMLNNPELLRSTLNPEVLQSFMQTAQGGSQTGAAAGSAPNVGAADIQNLLNATFAQRGGAAGSSGTGSNPQALENMLGCLLNNSNVTADAANTNVDPATRYRVQLRQLEDMGFIDKDANIMALQQTGGDINQAISWLLEAEQPHS